MMVHKVAVVIPALEANHYSPLGDLEKFGDSTILEWKVQQMEQVVGLENIFISTDSKKIAAFAKKYGVKCLHRQGGESKPGNIFSHWESIERKDVLIANVTSPFISPRIYKHMIAKYFSLPKKYDSLAAVAALKEYVFFNGQALNFDITRHQPRKDVKPVHYLTNGCFIARKDVFLKHKKFFGLTPAFYELDSLSKVEIKDVKDYAVSLDLIGAYMRGQLNEK